jgi:ankyrin repeat protein
VIGVRGFVLLTRDQSSPTRAWSGRMRKHPKRKDRPGVDRYGRTELHYAAADGDSQKVEALLASGLNAGAADDDGWTPLHAAVQA